MKKKQWRKRQVTPIGMARGHYTAKAVVVWCFDDRCSDALAAFLRGMHLRPVDVIMIAGGAKTLASPVKEEYRECVSEEHIAGSRTLHASPQAFIMLHSDCGKYGGLEAFRNEDAEAERYEAEFREAENFLRGKFGDALPVRKIFVDFDGVWEV